MVNAYPETLTQHGLSESEYEKILQILGREPNELELGIFSVMWSEHCSYKSTKKWLRTLPSKAPWVICGPGENAGVVDIGDGKAAVFKIESHNHPSYIEPYQGAATGVGGILRDVFTMGARPVANMNVLRFGNPGHEKTRHLVSGVVSGIGDYGNSVGVPTVGGECEFHGSFNGNVIVNAMTVGICDANNIFYSTAAGEGNPLVYVGSKTGRDGIHGATMASAVFDSDTENKRPTVQVGDPFTEKLLIEACLELMETDAIVAIQDMGAAGLTSSSFEMASKGHMGVDLDLDQIPARELEMSPYEFLLSESQERMLMVLKTGAEEIAREIFCKWELDFSVIGYLTKSGRMTVRKGKEIVADLPIDPLASASPEYNRPWKESSPNVQVRYSDIPKPKSIMRSLKILLSCPDLCSKRWIWEQYDSRVLGNTVQAPGGDAAVVRVDGTKKAIAITTDCTSRYCLADPMEGAKQAVAEAWRNLSSVGATPLAITDNLNFGNPEKPMIMGQFVESVNGIREACIELQFPVVSGNVSLYNETRGEAIMPTPVIGGIGVLADYRETVGIGFAGKEMVVFLVGECEGHLGQSLFLREVFGKEEGRSPPVNLSAEKKLGVFVRNQIEVGNISACHDISDGGLLVAIAEMALASDIGFTFDDQPLRLPIHAWAFGEDQARYLVMSNETEKLIGAANEAEVSLEGIGKTGGSDITIDGERVTLMELRETHESWLPSFMSK